MSDAAEAIRAEACTLVVGVLTIESSCAQEIERPAEGVPDTVQFWIGPTRRRKIRTYAVDRDVHVWDLADLGTARDTPVQFAVDHFGKHYGDILARHVVIELPNTSDTRAVQDALSEHGLTGGLQEAEWDGNRFAFWTPDGAEYITQTGESG